MIDKKDAVIIAFILVSAILSVWFISQTSLEVFRQGEVLDKAFFSNYLTQLRLNETLHEDQAREKQFEMENEARDHQRYEVVKDTNKSINESLVELENRLYIFMNLSEQRAITANKDRDSIQIQLGNITNEILNLTKQDYNESEDHREKSMMHHEEMIKMLQQMNTINNTR
jgi:hypothetical protein